MSRPPVVPITISGKDFPLTPALKNYVEAKLGRLTRFAPRAQRIGVELDIDHSQQTGAIYRVEVWVYFPNQTIEAGVKADDMHAAIDLVYPKLERQLVELKEKRLSRRRRVSRLGK